MNYTQWLLTLSTPLQIPQLLTDTDSLRLVPIVATCNTMLAFRDKQA